VLLLAGGEQINLRLKVVAGVKAERAIVEENGQLAGGSEAEAQSALSAIKTADLDPTG
jgi:hypothetical protein